MDATSRYSAGLLVPDITMINEISAFETVWIFASWAPDTVLFDPAFDKDAFTS